MNRIFETKVFLPIALALIAMLLLTACGSKQSPTGGKVDSEKIKLLASIPEEYADISEQKIELTFSKIIDRTTFLKGVYIYPTVENKKLSFDGHQVTIKFLEALKSDTNYYIILTTRIKDIRGNSLDNNQTLIYRHGKLQANRISGNIAYENPQDNGLPVLLNLLSTDSLWVMSKTFKGNSYQIDALNPQSYILRTFIDKNLNGRYDANFEPYQEYDISEKPISTYDLNMAYADTVKPAIRTIRSISNHEYEILLNKTVKTFQKISVQSERTKQDLQVFAVNHELDRITVLTSQTDTTKWQFTITELRDSKGNINLKSSMTITGTARQDKTLPAVLSTNPRSGATVNNLQPVLEITFSEIIPVSFFQASMIESDSKKEIPFRLTKSNSTTYRLQPEKPLENYKSCVLTIEDTTSDLSGNKLQQPFKLVFLPIFRTTKS